MPTYPSNLYGPGTSSTWNNNVRRRLDTKDNVAFATSSRFGGQYMEPKGNLTPYSGTIMDAVASLQQLVFELNKAQNILPDLGNPVLLGQVGLATNSLGAGVSYIGGVSTTATIDGTANTLGNRVLFYGLTTAALNGVYYVASAGGQWARVPELNSWWQFIRPKVFLVSGGTVNKGSVYALTTDAWETGPTFSIASGATLSGLTGTSIGFAVSNYAQGLSTNTSLIYPGYNAASVLNTGEYDFLAQASAPKFTYLKNRAQRMAYWVFKLRENFDPTVSSYQTNIARTIGVANTTNNIGFTTLNNLPSGSRYPSSNNRGF